MIIACIAVAAVVPAILSPASAQRRDVAISATVSRVDRGKYPGDVKVKLADVSCSPKGSVGRTIVVTPYYVRDSKGRPYLGPAPTNANLVAYYLLPGDRITGRLMAKGQLRGVYTITDLKRAPCAERPAPGPAPKGMELRTNLTEYPIGKPVRMELVVMNNTDRVMLFTFSSGQQFDFWVTRDGTEVWRWSRGKFFTQALTHLNLAPGQSKTFSTTWNQQDNDGRQVPIGSYVVSAQLTTSGERPPVLSKAIKIVPRRVSAAKISDILAKPEQYLGKTVSVSGVYYGWRVPRGVTGCESGPPVTRSDWIISDLKRCMYVTGLSDLDPVNDHGRNVSVLAEVKQTDKGQVYLRAEEVRAE
ncbi:MAG: BsuPI-related putative proteinase inhibitor [Armatimonadota bacterium]|nr:BsuPI-related putative proteinase inhibitor [Armatimonadota bacterium]